MNSSYLRRETPFLFSKNLFLFQLGVPKGKVIHTLTKSKALTEAAANSGGWAHIVVGQHHTLALDAAGNVHALGRMEYGRLGTSLLHIQNLSAFIIMKQHLCRKIVLQ